MAVHAQSTLTISGKLIDSDTREPLVFASIGIKDQSISTISNSIGEFDFHIPSDLKSGTLVVSMMGYQDFMEPVSSLLQRDSLVLLLNKSTQVLDEVVIEDSLSGAEITRIAFSKIDQNYPMKPYLLDGFYRDVKQIGGTYFSLLEAAVQIYDDDYAEPNNKVRLRERVGLVEIRKSLGYDDNRFSKYFGKYNLLEELLLHNDIRYRKFPKEDAFYNGFSREKTTFYNNHKVHVTLLSSPYYMKLYIDTETYAIIRVEYEQHYDDDNILKKKVNSVAKYVSEKKVIDFKQYQAKMYLAYMKVVSQVNWYDNKTNDLNFETETLQELLINQVFPNTEQRISNVHKMKRYGLQYQDHEPNQGFWKNYNVIKETPLDKKIISDLESAGALGKEFQY